LAEVKTHEELVNVLSEGFDTFPPINILYSTRDDHYGYFALGKFPLRSHPHMGMFIQDGSLSANDWLGYVTGKDKLHLIDP
jgi:acyl-homoserine lactone acylase PvdQ